MSKFCPKCGKELNNNVKFCVVCGYHFANSNMSKINNDFVKNLIIAILIILIIISGVYLAMLLI